jgi:hypothetical protein
MPDRGLRDVTEFEARDVVDRAAPLVFHGARVLQVTYEISREACLDVLPTDASRPVPSYGRILVIDAENGPWGTLSLCALFVGARFRMMPRNSFADGIASSGGERLSSNTGAAFREGRITLTRNERSVTANLEDGDGPLASATLPQLRPVDPAMLRWDVWLTFGRADGIIRPLEVTVTTRTDTAFLSKGATFDLAPALPKTHLWRRLRNLNTISACYFEGSITLERQAAVASPG